MIQSVIDALCVNIEKYRRTQKPLNLLHAFSAVATDVICQYTFGESRHNVDKSDFAPEWYEMLMNPSEFSHTMKQFGWLFPLMEATPEWIVKKINKPVYDLIMLQKGYGIQIQDILDGNDKPTEYGLKRTIFHEILKSDLPAHEKTKERLMAETQLIITAGTVTVTHMLKLTAFFLLENPDMTRKLKDELQSAIPDSSRSASWTQLQNLPYLTAVVHEGLRMSYGVCHRLQRIKPDGSLFFRDWVIPAGTPVSMTSVLMHTNPLIFPNPVEFRPERWLDQEGLRLEKYLVPFSRGTRSCIGSNLAYAEIYMTLATVFRRFDFELFETTRADVDMEHDFFNPCVRLSSKGIRAKVKSSVWKGWRERKRVGKRIRMMGNNVFAHGVTAYFLLLHGKEAASDILQEEVSALCIACHSLCKPGSWYACIKWYWCGSLQIMYEALPGSICSTGLHLTRVHEDDRKTCII